MKISFPQKSNLSDSLCLLVIGLVGIFYILTLCPGHDWGDDFSAYINGAKNIASGKDYTLTGFIIDPLNDIGPGYYPPVTSICLAAVYALFGMNISAFKIEGIVFFSFFLAIVWRSFRDKLPSFYTPALLVFLGLNPLFFNFKDSILSEYYFIFFLYLLLLVVEIHQDEYGGKDTWGWGAWIGGLLCILYNTRTIGIVFFVAFIIHEIFTRRSPSLFLKIALVFVAGECAQRVIFHFDVLNYLSVPTNFYWSIFLNSKGILDHTEDFFAYCYAGHARAIVASILFFLGTWGYIAKVREMRRLSVYEIFFILYSLTLLAAPPMCRYLFPIFPLAAFYVFYGIKSCQKYSLLIFILCFGMIIAGYFIKYVHTADYECSEPYGFCSQEAVGLFSFIKNNTSKNDLIIFNKPRALYLATQRRSTPFPRSPKYFFAYCDQRGVAYAAFFNNEDDLRYLKIYKERLLQVYKNNDFIFYKYLKVLPKGV